MYIDTHTKVLLKNKDDDSKQVWLQLPFDEDELNEALLSIGVRSSEDTEDTCDAFDQVVNGKMLSGGYEVVAYESDYLGEEDFEDIFVASDLIERIEDFESYQQPVLDALLQEESLETAIEELEDDDIEFYPDVTLTELAEQFGDEDLFSTKYLLEHVDWEAVGRDLSIDGYEEVRDGVIKRG